MSKSCYYCGNPATSKEHIPPRSMFKGFDADSITVPSCDNHNTQKSGLDQAVIAAFLIALDPYSLRLHSDVKKAIKEGKPSFERAKRKAFSSRLISDLPDVRQTSYLSEDIIPWISQLTAGFIHSATNYFDATIQWENIRPWSPNWLPFSTPITQKEFLQLKLARLPLENKWASFQWIDGWSPHPRPYPAKIFHFHLYFERKKVFFKYTFYNAYFVWYVDVLASRKTLTLLKRKIGI